tara:strand:+ start:333 stop:728 length:396 start_codon:yes stop_codon:yes gene_type:complete
LLLFNQEGLLIRILLIIFGLIFTGFGLIGIVVPGLPTTIFLIIAAACFVRSSPTLYNKLINSPVLGKYVKDYLEGKGMPVYAKVISIFMVLLACFISSFYLLSDSSLIIKIFIIVLGIFGTIFILKVPSKN